MSEAPKSPLFSNSTYDALKYIALVVLPAMAVLYAALGGLLSLPATLQVAGAIMAVDTFLGAILGLSTKQYNALTGDPKYDGVINVTTDATKKIFQLELHDDPEPLELKDTVTFKVNNERTE